jgi:hypothetical protein
VLRQLGSVLMITCPPPQSAQDAILVAVLVAMLVSRMRPSAEPCLSPNSPILRNLLVYLVRLRSRKDRASLLDLFSSLPKSFGAKSTISGYPWALVDVGAVRAGARERFFAASASV